MNKIKKNDEVIVIAGKDKGKRGKVVRVLEGSKLIVSGIQMIKKHQKPNPQANIPGGIIEKEAPIQLSNVAIFNSATNKADRVGFDLDEKTNEKFRIFKSTGKKVDA